MATTPSEINIQLKTDGTAARGVLRSMVVQISAWLRTPEQIMMDQIRDDILSAPAMTKRPLALGYLIAAVDAAEVSGDGVREIQQTVDAINQALAVPE